MEGLAIGCGPPPGNSAQKQFCNFGFDRTLLRQTLDRFTSKHFAPPIIVTNENYRFLVNEELTVEERHQVKILLEPSPKNTLPAVILGHIILSIDIRRFDADFCAIRSLVSR